ncbi:MAG: NAD(P)-dependent oxidoreductase [Proteobacteria bacterium]|nr:MAG: NAD(P)-dependent oxidoreductase [Pseudomonadota bacterium]
MAENHPDETWFLGNLQNKDEFPARWLTPGGTLIHLAYSGRHEPEVIHQLHTAAHDAGIERIIFCSTAMVVGQTEDPVITEDSTAHPKSLYELEKTATEVEIVRLKWAMPVTILRPTAVFGPNGKNLIFAMSDFYADGIKNRLRRIIFGTRSMHLVSVHNVVEAILHLAKIPKKQLESVYQVTDDDAAQNQFHELFREFVRFRNLPDLGPSVGGPFLPAHFLKLFLKATGRSLVNPKARFSQDRLIRSGYRPVISLEKALLEFFSWYDSKISNKT